MCVTRSVRTASKCLAEPTTFLLPAWRQSNVIPTVYSASHNIICTSPTSRLQWKTPRGCSHRSQGLTPRLSHPVLAPPCLESGRGQIPITWQSHSRRLHRFPSRPRPAPQTALLLPHRPSFALGAQKKSLQPCSRRL